MEVKAIATELDGTITNRVGVLNLDAIKKIRILEKIHVPVILVSGQNIYSASTLSYYIGASTLTVAENGGVISYFFQKPKILGAREPADQAYLALRKECGEKIRTTRNTHLRFRDITFQRRFHYKVAKEFLANTKIKAKMLQSKCGDE